MIAVDGRSKELGLQGTEITRYSNRAHHQSRLACARGGLLSTGRVGPGREALRHSRRAGGRGNPGEEGGCGGWLGGLT